MCSGSSGRLWSADWWRAVQFGGSVVLLPRKGYVAEVWSPKLRLVCLVDWCDRISFFCAMVAAMTLKFLDPFGSGKLVLFQVTYDRVGSSYFTPSHFSDRPKSNAQDWHAYELIFFLVLGVVGVCGLRSPPQQILI